MHALNIQHLTNSKQKNTYCPQKKTGKYQNYAFHHKRHDFRYYILKEIGCNVFFL